MTSLQASILHEFPGELSSHFYVDLGTSQPAAEKTVMAYSFPCSPIAEAAEPQFLMKNSSPAPDASSLETALGGVEDLRQTLAAA